MTLVFLALIFGFSQVESKAQIVIDGTVNWSAGNISTTPHLTIGSTGILNYLRSGHWTVSGTLNVGGTLDMNGKTMYVTSDNTVNITGGVLENGGNILIGYGTNDGAMTISGGGSASHTTAFVGASASSAAGTVTITDSGSLWETTVSYLGWRGAGLVDITSGKWTNSGVTYLGNKPGGVGTVDVKSGGEWTVTSTTVLGNDYSNTTSYAQGNVTINASIWNTIKTIVGNSGTGIISIDNGGTWTATGETNMAIGSNANGTITIDGSTWNGKGVTVASFGTGLVTVQNAGNWTADGNVILGINNGSDGTVIIQGSTANPPLSVASETAAMSEWTVTGTTTIGSKTGSNGEVTITGSNWNSEKTYVGSSGTGIVTVEKSTALLPGNVTLVISSLWTSGETVLGLKSNASGTITIDESTWISNNTVVASYGTGEVTIENNALWTENGYAYIGLNFGTGKVTVKGNSVWTVAGDTILGSVSGGKGEVSITNSTWDTAKTIVGRAGIGTVDIEAGGVWTVSGKTYLGFGSGTGTVNINDGGKWTTNDEAYVGYGANSNSIINIESGGEWTSNGMTRIGWVNNSSGTINVGWDGIGSAPSTEALWTAMGEVKVGGRTDPHTGTVNITQTGRMHVRSGQLNFYKYGLVNLDGGVLDVVGDFDATPDAAHNSNFGFNFQSGLLRVAGDLTEYPTTGNRHVITADQTVELYSGTDTGGTDHDGNWTTASNREISVEGNLNVIDSATLDAQGGLELAGGTIFVDGIARIFNFDVSTKNGTDSTIDTASDLTIGGQLSGEGGFEKVGAATLTLQDYDGFDGDITVSAGTLRADATGTLGGALVNNTVVDITGANTLTLDGDVSGSGDFTGAGSVVFAGTYGPGNSAAVVSITNATFDGSNLLTMEIGGLTEGDGAGYHDHIDFTGTVQFGGDLDVRLIDAYVPSPQGTRFDLFDWAPGQASGTFDDVNFYNNAGTLVNDEWTDFALYTTGEVLYLGNIGNGPILVAGEGVDADGAYVNPGWKATPWNISNTVGGNLEIGENALAGFVLINAAGTDSGGTPFDRGVVNVPGTVSTHDDNGLLILNGGVLDITGDQDFDNMRNFDFRSGTLRLAGTATNIPTTGGEHRIDSDQEVILYDDADWTTTYDVVVRGRLLLQDTANHESADVTVRNGGLMRQSDLSTVLADSLTVTGVGGGNRSIYNLLGGQLTVDGGDLVAEDGAYFNQAAGTSVVLSTGDVIVQGAGGGFDATYDLASDLMIQGSHGLRVGDDGVFNFNAGTLTRNVSGDSVNITVSGGTFNYNVGSTWDYNGSMLIGDDGLLDMHGSDLHINSATSVVVGAGSNVVGVTSTAGSIIGAGVIRVGDTADGYLEINSGSSVTGSGNAYIGIAGGVIGTTLVTGDDGGSPTPIPSTWTIGGGLDIGGATGAAGEDTLTITNGGVVNVGGDMNIYYSGYSTQKGARTIVNVEGDMSINAGGYDLGDTGAPGNLANGTVDVAGDLTLSDGGTFWQNSDETVAGRTVSVGQDLLVAGSGSLYTLDAGTLGVAGSGTVNDGGGIHQTGGRAEIGAGLTVTNSGSTYDLDAGVLHVVGPMFVSDGGQFNQSSGLATVRGGDVSISDAGTTFTQSGGDFYFDDRSMTVDNGASASLSGGATLAGDALGIGDGATAGTMNVGGAAGAFVADMNVTATGTVTQTTGLVHANNLTIDPAGTYSLNDGVNINPHPWHVNTAVEIDPAPEVSDIGLLQTGLAYRLTNAQLDPLRAAYTGIDNDNPPTDQAGVVEFTTITGINQLTNPTDPADGIISGTIRTGSPTPTYNPATDPLIGGAGQGTVNNVTEATIIANDRYLRLEIADTTRSWPQSGDNPIQLSGLGGEIGLARFTQSLAMGENTVLAIDLDPSNPGQFGDTGWWDVAMATASDTLQIADSQALTLDGTLDLRALSRDWARGQEFNILDFDLAANDSDGDGFIDSNFETYIIPYLHDDGYAVLAHEDLVLSQFIVDLGEVGEGIGGYLRWDFTELYSRGIIRVVPEPAAWLTAGLALLGLLAYRQRRNRAKS